MKKFLEFVDVNWHRAAIPVAVTAFFVFLCVIPPEFVIFAALALVWGFIALSLVIFVIGGVRKLFVKKSKRVEIKSGTI